ncbi:piggyBac transposable element-derived protein 4-like isoform X1 [Bombus vosnesenskii]|uniref:PiggyBac transposable element-derived protein 4-like isoform X1 n=1 Tax=Bombus vosnesenskii TaxID=207650 RepID=A0A6J3KSA9_9HYME|nr:piggyBac transposable element-derived protein 4-like isoform X1 [Bombus vosnesenskii]XP_033354740.1 piggyBac transposable element-derived protein 4-like isoform X1 [Bombus vosnesenskii]XP_033354742.1 piggyBac transposable element-derived protein 4-like isoform X1 [Bombus vosnesenskii]XP_033354743.1 piggyBac transposable element-derived protein 4-like isoform X1 [Bombus vosnesenskii]XP_033354744.1 piggyBac transposable element-derived protein 4-like isoform X1 [Bombus vosnesenskii]
MYSGRKDDSKAMDTKKKRTKSSWRPNSTSESDDSSSKIVPVSKRRRIDVFDTSSSEDSIPCSFICSATSASASINDIGEQENLFSFTEGTGPQPSLTNKSKPIDYFNLFIDSFLLTLMVHETNKYAEQLIKSRKITQRSRMKLWKPVTLLEIKAFIAVLLEMGITRRPTIFSYWTENSRSIPWFSKMFSRNRFQLIYQCFHLVDNKECFPPGHEKYDPCLKFMPIVEHANRVSKLISTHASNDNTIVIKKRNENERSGAKPYIGDSYDSYMRGVGKSDKMLYVYLDERRTVKYWKKITFHIIARMVLNSYLFYKEVSKKKPMTRLEFTSSIISEIEHEWMQVKKQHMVSDNDRIFGLMKLPGRNLRQCVVCSSKINGIKRSNLICMQCKKGLHPLCLHKHVCFKNNECHDPVKP